MSEVGLVEENSFFEAADAQGLPPGIEAWVEILHSILSAIRKLQ